MRLLFLRDRNEKVERQVDLSDENDIPMQRAACEEFASRNRWTITKEFHEKGVSGFKVSASKRDSIQDLKKAAEKGEFDILLVYMFDRIGRIDDETSFIVEWFVQQGIEVWSVKEGEQRFDSHVDKFANSTVNRMLKNRLYCGYYVSGDVISPHLPHLQIIEEELFAQAQKIMAGRAIKSEEKSQITRNTKGKTLLSGNISCAHCGSNLIATSYIDSHTRKDGSKYTVRRQRYICTNKARKRGECDGQSAYVSTRIDVAVDAIVREYLARIKTTAKSIALEKRYRRRLQK